MSEQANYFKIGTVVLVGLSILMVFLAFFGAGDAFRKKIYFETYFDQSIQGLDRGAPVKYRGVTIGEVESIEMLGRAYDLDFDDEAFYERGSLVVVRMALDPTRFKDAPSQKVEEVITKLIREKGLRVQLSYLGLTGVGYLEANYFDPVLYPPFEIDWAPKYLYIPSVPSTIARVGETFQQFTRTFEEDFIPLIENVRVSSKGFPELSRRLNEVLRQAEPTMKNLRELSAAAKLYPSQFVLGSPPPKSQFDR